MYACSRHEEPGWMSTSLRLSLLVRYVFTLHNYVVVTCWNQFFVQLHCTPHSIPRMSLAQVHPLMIFICLVIECHTIDEVLTCWQNYSMLSVRLLWNSTEWLQWLPTYVHINLPVCRPWPGRILIYRLLWRRFKGIFYCSCETLVELVIEVRCITCWYLEIYETLQPS